MCRSVLEHWGIGFSSAESLSLLTYKEIFKLSQVNTLPKAKSETRSKQDKDMHKCSSVYSERGVPLPVLTSGGE
jgi:hypothetical protein